MPDIMVWVVATAICQRRFPIRRRLLPLVVVVLVCVMPVAAAGPSTTGSPASTGGASIGESTASDGNGWRTTQTIQDAVQSFSPGDEAVLTNPDQDGNNHLVWESTRHGDNAELYHVAVNATGRPVTEPLRITTNPEPTASPKAVIGPEGDVHIFYIQYNGSVENTYLKHVVVRDGNVVHGPQRIREIRGVRDDFHPPFSRLYDIAVTDDRVHVLALDPMNYYGYLKGYTGGVNDHVAVELESFSEVVHYAIGPEGRVRNSTDNVVFGELETREQWDGIWVDDLKVFTEIRATGYEGGVYVSWVYKEIENGMNDRDEDELRAGIDVARLEVREDDSVAVDWTLPLTEESTDYWTVDPDRREEVHYVVRSKRVIDVGLGDFTGAFGNLHLVTSAKTYHDEAYEVGGPTLRHHVFDNQGHNRLSTDRGRWGGRRGIHGPLIGNGSKLYLLNNTLPLVDDHDKPVERNEGWAALYRYDPETNSWKRIPTDPPDYVEATAMNAKGVPMVLHRESSTGDVLISTLRPEMASRTSTPTPVDEASVEQTATNQSVTEATPQAAGEGDGEAPSESESPGFGLGLTIAALVGLIAVRHHLSTRD